MDSRIEDSNPYHSSQSIPTAFRLSRASFPWQRPFEGAFPWRSQGSPCRMGTRRMENSWKVLALIPARGGSKGIPGKNLRLLAGRPLVAHAVRNAREVPGIGRVVLSTDSEEIAEAGRGAGAEVPFLRPPALAGDES